jgi:hypothetical protein
MGEAYMEIPMGDNERYIRLYDSENHTAYVARFCVACNRWMDKEGGTMQPVEGSNPVFQCRFHE